MLTKRLRIVMQVSSHSTLFRALCKRHFLQLVSRTRRRKILISTNNFVQMPTSLFHSQSHTQATRWCQGPYPKSTNICEIIIHQKLFSSAGCLGSQRSDFAKVKSVYATHKRRSRFSNTIEFILFTFLCH